MLSRKSFLQKASVAGSLLLLSKFDVFANAMQIAGFEIKMLTNSIGIFNEKGGTILFHYSKKGIVVVDSQFPDTAINLITELQKLSNQPFQYLFNTHHHGDHSGGNIAFKGLVKNIIAHQNSAANQKTVAIKQKTEEKQLYPTKTFTEQWSTKFGKEKIKLFYFGPAHTNGDIVVHFSKANIVHLGDLMFNRRYPYIDRAAGASIQNWISVLQQIQQKFNNETIFVFGHANTGFQVTGKKSDIRAFELFLDQLLNFVKTEIKAGKTKEEILKAKQIPGNTAWFGDGIERVLTAAHAECTERIGS